ncbi:MAG: hypothetical protein Q8O66_02140 [bacterium]|nr:hypothetical protein [bacterium]
MNTQINNEEEIDFNDAPKNHSDSVKHQEEELPPDQIFDPEMPKMVRWVIKRSRGIIKDEKQASFVLLVFAIAIIIISLFFFFSSNGGSESQNNLMMPAEL